MNIIAQRLRMLFYIISFAFLFVSCAAGSRYQDRTVAIQNYIKQGNFAAALNEIESNKFLNAPRNRLLYLMEKGKVEHMNRNYEESNRLLEEAYILIDDQIKSSVGQAVAAKFVNPMQEPYKGEDFEKVIIHYYKALNFFALGDPQAALVEAKRIDIKLHELNQRYKNNKNKYSRDAFSQILQGILYEATGDINNAFIAYRNAEIIFLENDNVYFGVPIPEQLKKDLLRTSRIMGFRDEYSLYKKRYPDVVESPASAGEAIIFWENGRGPQKGQTKLSASGVEGVFVATYDDGEEDLVITLPTGSSPSINVIAIPKYEQSESYYNSASIITEDNEEFPLQMSENFFYIAKQSLRDRMLREVGDMILRFATKKATSYGLGELAKQMGGKEVRNLTRLVADGVGAALEEADTRNWQSLPATIHYVRVPLNENEPTTLQIKKVGPTIDYETLVIPYKKGLQITSIFDIGRSQETPVSFNPEKLGSEIIEEKDSETLKKESDKKLQQQKN